MVQVVCDSPTPPAHSLVDLSRNTSVISTSSSSSGSSTFLPQPLRPPRPLRPFSAPRRSQSRDHNSPATPRASSRPPAFITKDLAVADGSPSPADPPTRPNTLMRSRNNSLAGKFSANDFTFDPNPLGEGSFSEVLKGTHNVTRKVYAIKIVDKKLLMREGKVNTAHAEKNSLTKLGAKGHPGVIKLHWTFQDEWNLYFVLDLAPNGDLQTRIQQLGSLTVECTRFYMAQVLDGLQWMHQKGVLHRDLKPENVLLDSEMRVKITDFGTSKSFDESDTTFRATTWVGTAQYIAPELILHTFTCKSSDIWAVGCMLFQCISGRFPFVAKTQYLMWEKVKKLEYDFPEGFDDDAKDLVAKILVLDPAGRLGAGLPHTILSPESLRQHPFFVSVDWDTLWTREVPQMSVGMYTRPPEHDGDGNVYDVGAAWDALVGGDGIPWIGSGPDGHSNLPLEFIPSNPHYHPDGIAPHQVLHSGLTPNVSTDMNIRTEEPTREENIELEKGMQDMIIRSDASQRARAERIIRESPQRPEPKLARGSFSTTGSKSVSGSSSSDQGTSNVSSDPPRGGSSAGSHNGGPTSPTSPPRTDTGLPIVEKWLAALASGETPILTSPVIPRATLRQRASYILPSVSPIRLPAPRIKKRQLVLTSERLLCLKLKEGRAPSVKSEVLFSAKRLSVAKKGEREFIVQGAGKTYTYSVNDEALASRWVQQIGDAMDAHRGRRATRT